MKKQFRQILAVLLCALLLVGAAPTVLAADGTGNGDPAQIGIDMDLNEDGFENSMDLSILNYYLYDGAAVFSELCPDADVTKLDVNADGAVDSLDFVIAYLRIACYVNEVATVSVQNSANAVSLIVGDCSAEPGETFSVPIYVSSECDLASAHFRLLYDASVMDVLGADVGGAAQACWDQCWSDDRQITCSDGEVSFFLHAPDMSPRKSPVPMFDNGTLLTIHGRLKEDAPDGCYPFELLMQQTDLIESYGCSHADTIDVVCPNLSVHVGAVTVSTHQHAYSAQVTTEPTCTTDGELTHTCTLCGDTYTETIPATGHSFGSLVWVWTNDFSAATATFTCANGCGEERVLHADEIRIETVSECTCTSNHTVRYTASVTVDGTEYTDTTEEIVLEYGRHIRETRYENRVEPTCRFFGCYDYVVYCSVCGEEMWRNQVLVPALGHDFGTWTVTIEPTDTAPGQETRYCLRCSMSETREIPPLTADEPLLEVIGDCARAGRTVEVSVRLRSNPGFIATALRMSYDPQVLTLLEVRNGSVFPDSAFHQGGDLTAVPFGTIWVQSLSDSNNMQNGTLVTYVFRIAEDTREHITRVTVTYDTDSTIDMDLEPVTFSVQDDCGMIVILVPGDVDGDGLVTLKDVMLLLRYIVGGWDAEIHEKTADVNADGKVDLRDVVLIERYLAGGWDVELL